MRVLLALLLAIPLLLAGCVQSPSGEPPVDRAAQDDRLSALRAAVADLPCEADVGKDTSANLRKLGMWSAEEGDIGEADIRGDLALLTRHAMGGLDVVDVRDPRNPVHVGGLAIEESAALDVKWTVDGDGAYVADFGRIHLIDLADPANPVLAGTFDYKEHGLSGQAHMVEPMRIEGKEYLFVATQVTRLPLYVLLREGWNLTHVTSYAQLPAVNTLPLGNHDVTAMVDELLEKPVIYVADGLLGWYVADVSDPANPKRLGGTLSLEPGAGYTHTVRVGFYEGKRIVVTMSEVGVNTLKVYDATKLDAPILLGRWNADPARPHIPQHNIQLHGDLLYMGHYTEGVYVFNLSAVIHGPPLLGTLAIKPIAHWANEEQEEPTALGFANVWDVLLKDGVIWITDGVGTFTGVAFGCVPAGDPAYTAVD